MDAATVIGLFVASGVSLLGALVCVGFTYAARPSALRRETNLLSDAVANFERELIKQDSRGTELLSAVESIHKTVEDDLDRAETKRKQAAARGSKARAANGQPEIDLNDRGQLAALARARGIDV